MKSAWGARAGGWALLLLLLQSWAQAQNFDFKPPVAVTDQNTPAVMRDLADRILPVYQEGNPDKYLATLSTLQLVAGNYTAAYASRQSLRDRRSHADAGRLFQRALVLDLYTHARAVEATNRVPFAQAFGTAYKEVIPKLNDFEAYVVVGWLTTSLNSLQQPIQRSFDRHRGKSTIELPDALELVENYALFDAHRNFGPIVGALDTEDEARRYESQDDILIKTRDGIQLAARLVRPKNATKPLPTLLEFTTYLTPGYAREAAAHGYVGVVAYARGRGKSSGNPAPLQRDGEDVRTVVDWIAMQPWSNGSVGMYGSNYSGFTPWAAAKKLPTALKAIAVSSPTAPGLDFPADGGIFRNSIFPWALYVTNAIDEKAYDDDAAWRTLDLNWYASGKRYKDLATLYGKPNPLFTSWLAHPGYDKFWQDYLPTARELAKVKIPVLTMTGYYSEGAAAALYYFNLYNNPNHTLFVGPYDDGVIIRGVQPSLRGYQIDAAAVVDLRELRYQWFDHVLKGSAIPSLLQARVNYQVMGSNEWRHVQSLEAMSNRSQKFYLDPTAVNASHRLSPEAPAAPTKKSPAKFVEEALDLRNRDDLSNWIPQPDIANHSVDVRYGTAYVSDPLQKPFELEGAWSAHFELSINKADVDLKVAAYELLANGDYLQLFEPYRVRASYAKDRAHRALLKPGERQVLAFKIPRLTSRKLQVGSRLVLIVAVNKRPDEEINYGTGGDVSAESVQSAGSKTPLKIRWYSGSYIEMPVQASN